MSTIKPIFLLADSQLLFWRDDEGLFLRRVRKLVDEDLGETGANGADRSIRAAYLGASNGDAPEFYELFLGAMDQIGVRNCRLIPEHPEPADLEFLETAQVILLAGGDVERGWESFKQAGLDKKLVERYYAGALLLGISAGAVQLGLKGWNASGEKIADMLRIVPFVVDVHDEPSWARLLLAVPRAGEHSRGIGIPSGGGALYHPDYSVEPVRHPLTEVSQSEAGVQQALLLPGVASEPATPPPAADGAPSAGAEPVEQAEQVEQADPPQDGEPQAGPDAAAGSPNVPAPAPAAAPAAAKTPPVSPAGGKADEEADPVERSRRELGYSIGRDGIIEIHRPDSPDSPNSPASSEEPIN